MGRNGFAVKCFIPPLWKEMLFKQELKEKNNISLQILNNCLPFFTFPNYHTSISTALPLSPRRKVGTT